MRTSLIVLAVLELPFRSRRVGAGCGFLAASVLATHALGAPFVPDGNMPREQIPELHKWKLDPLFPEDAAFEKGMLDAKSLRDKLLGFRGKLGSPADLASCLAIYFETRLLTNRLTLYAHLRFDGAQKDAKLSSMNDRSLEAMNELMRSSSFIRQEVLALDAGAMAAARKAEPKLAAYAPYLDGLLRRKSRVLSPEAESVLALAGDNLWAEIDLNELPSDHEKTFGALLGDLPMPSINDENGKPVKLTLASYSKYRASSDRRVRKEAVDALLGTLKQYHDALASTLSGQVKTNILFARARGYSTALEAYLDKDQIDPSVYRSLVAGVRNNLAPLHRYIRLRKQLMGLSDIHLYDLYAPMVKSVLLDFDYAEASKIVPQALTPLGNDYVSVVKLAIDPKNGWVDVYPNKDKESGAFCSAVHGVHPFLKLNYFGGLDDVSTLAHELGHAVHSHLSMKHQPYVTSNYAAFNAEIASTINEKLLSDHLIARAKTDEERLFLLNELVETIRTTIYRQALFAEFELAAHTAAESGTPLTAELLEKTYGGLLRDYYGPEFVIDANDDAEWAYIPHFYYKYYVFTYATGLAAGIALSEKIKREGPSARDAYLGMLKGGSAAPPLELLRRAGVDLTKSDAIDAAGRLLAATLDEMEKIAARLPKK
ncbi:MAG: oligoendopeptidase F [Deltaproteobacteria bacterium]|nr:oligoendopeptidase F [Deltaproteobacteria bacterium]